MLKEVVPFGEGELGQNLLTLSPSWLQNLLDG